MKLIYKEYSIELDEMNMDWSVKFYGKRIGYFEFFEDDKGKIWAWNFSIDNEHQKKGIATEVVRQAVARYGAVYFYIGSRTQLNTSQGAGDSRYLTEEGAVLVPSLIRKGIIKEEWALKIV